MSVLPAPLNSSRPARPLEAAAEVDEQDVPIPLLAEPGGGLWQPLSSSFVMWSSDAPLVTT